MDRSLLIGLIAGAGTATAVGGLAHLERNGRTAEPVAAVAPAPDAVGGPLVRDGAVPPGYVAGTVPPGYPGAVPPGYGAVPPGYVAGYPPGTVPPGYPAPAFQFPAAPASVATPRVEYERPPLVRASRSTPRVPSYARVVDVQPVTQTVSDPREVCRDEPVVNPAPVRDEQRVAGTLLGAAIGGLLGNQVGGGDGKKIATVAGAVAGGYAGNRVQDRIQRSNTVTTLERRCDTVYDRREKTVGYDVTYEFDGQFETVRMKQAPGSRLPVRDGQVILTANAG